MTEPSGRPDPWALPDISRLTVGVLGGTGEQGRGLAARWSAAGLAVVLGSRDPARAAEAANGVGALAAEMAPAGNQPGEVRGTDNAGCVEAADVVLVAVPWSAHGETLAGLATALTGRILIDCVNPLGFDAAGAFALGVPEGSAAQQAAALLPGSRVVAAFHHVSAKVLLDPAIHEVAADVLVLGDDRAATDTVAALAAAIPGTRGVYAGRLRNAHQVEAMTANLISINRRYRAHSSVRVTGI